MKAEITQRLDTTWANAVQLSLVVELDNPHALVTTELLSLMVHRMRLFCEEVRAENERALVYEEGTSEELRDEARRREGVGTEHEREREAHAEMMRGREEIDPGHFAALRRMRDAPPPRRTRPPDQPDEQLDQES